MTPHLHVQVSLHGAVIEDRLVRVCGTTWLGECDGAEVAFHGAILSVLAADGALWLKGAELEPDQPVLRSWGDVSVRLEAVIPDTLPRDWSWVPDARMLVATVALTLAGAFVDTLAIDWRERDSAERVAAAERVRRYAEPPAEAAADDPVGSKPTWTLLPVTWSDGVVATPPLETP